MHILLYDICIWCFPFLVSVIALILHCKHVEKPKAVRKAFQLRLFRKGFPLCNSIHPFALFMIWLHSSKAQVQRSHLKEQDWP